MRQWIFPLPLTDLSTASSRRGVHQRIGLRSLEVSERSLPCSCNPYWDAASRLKVRLHTGTAEIVHLSTFEKNHPRLR